MPSPARADAAERMFDLAATQHSLLTAAQCHEMGLSRNAIHRHLTSGVWTREGPGVYRVAGAARTWLGRALDVAAVSRGDLEVLRALDQVRRLGLATWPELWEALVLHARPGRRGIRCCRAALDARYGRSVPHNEFARLLLRILARAGVPEPVSEHSVSAGGCRYRLDAAYVSERIAIELDGRVHLTEAVYAADRVRDNALSWPAGSSCGSRGIASRGLRTRSSRRPARLRQSRA